MSFGTRLTKSFSLGYLDLSQILFKVSSFTAPHLTRSGQRWTTTSTDPRTRASLSSIGSPMTEVMKIFTALRGLGKDFEPIKTAIEGTIDSVPSTTFDSIIPRLVAFDDRLKSYDTGQEVTPHLAFSSERTGQGGQYNTSRGRGNRGRSGGRGRGSYSTRGRGFMQQFASSDSDTRIVCQICGKPGHPAFRCYFRFNNNYQSEEPSQALAAMRITDITDEGSSDWYADSAATAHVTNSVQNQGKKG